MIYDFEIGIVMSFLYFFIRTVFRRLSSFRIYFPSKREASNWRKGGRRPPSHCKTGTLRTKYFESPKGPYWIRSHPKPSLGRERCCTTLSAVVADIRSIHDRGDPAGGDLSQLQAGYRLGTIDLEICLERLPRKVLVNEHVGSDHGRASVGLGRAPGRLRQKTDSHGTR